MDLRWGVTDEQRAEGKVLPICLEEINRCRPYFIGILGGRYGLLTDPLSASPDLLEREPWLKEHLDEGKSLTELEILHGVLNNPKMADHSFFYFRDPATCRTQDDPQNQQKLQRLKERIRASKLPVHENYRDPKDLGEQVLKDMTAVIDRLFPEGSQPDPLDREAMDHEAYAQSRRLVYIGGEKYFERLDAHAAAQDNQPLVILGESGSGKSALLANWVHRYQQQHPEVLVLQHYIGASPYSADWAAMLRRIMGEFKRRLGIQQEIPNQPDALRSAFPNWLYMAGAKGKVVLVLDALNQLEDRNGAPDLVWLPPVMPENVRLIISTLPGRPLDEVKKRNWPTLSVEPLTPEDRRELVAHYLSQYAKRLNAGQLKRIVESPQSANPLYLHVLLNELRVFGVFEKLDQRIDGYLQAQSPYELYQKVIARWEEDYEGDTDLVGDTLSLLWAARRGLSESELLEALGKDGQPLPRAMWAPLFLAISDGLVRRRGLLIFAHDFLRTATRDAYVPSLRHQRTSHRRLANYFGSTLNDRAMDELPWQLIRAEAWSDLHRLFSDPILFSVLCKHHLTDVVAHWVELSKSLFQNYGKYRLIRLTTRQQAAKS